MTEKNEYVNDSNKEAATQTGSEVNFATKNEAFLNRFHALCAEFEYNTAIAIVQTDHGLLTGSTLQHYYDEAKLVTLAARQYMKIISKELSI